MDRSSFSGMPGQAMHQEQQQQQQEDMESMWAAATAQPDYYSTSDAASQLHTQLPVHLPTGGASTSSSSGGGGGGIPSLPPLYTLPSTPMPNFDMPLQGGGMRMNVGTVPMALLVRSTGGRKLIVVEQGERCRWARWTWSREVGPGRSSGLER